MNCAAALPPEDLLSQSLPNIAHRFQSLLRTRRSCPILVELTRDAAAKQISRLKPAQECDKIGKKLGCLTILNRARIQEVQCQVVPQEEESVLPVRTLIGLRFTHLCGSKIITPIMNHFIGYHI